MKNKKSDDIVYRHLTLKHEVEVFAPPPPGVSIHSPYNTLEEWLAAICDTESPQISISTYSFGTFESADEWLLFLVGENNYQKDQYSSTTRIDFKPSYMYFRLPEKEFKNKVPEKVRKQLFMKLKEFTHTEKFKSSFLAKAYNAVLNGETFWHR